ncbi:ABC transporter permease [Flavivirga algicola]|uniref:ABC transporter permease n=1 Tax=Flavivirga algicola TaxID=2729136 RepID=A0ABX1RZ87_9FLAO|nr:ABC transporter permease [Flavivirga algicola]NMH88901.1 hypothetical protein [Flavivirga algicola]
MFKNNLKFALRVFGREKFFTAINIGGLALGFAVCILVLGYVTFEFSYEEHIKNRANVYRVTTTRYVHDKKVFEGTKGPSILEQIAPVEIPNIEHATRAYFEPCLVRTDEKKYAKQKVYWVDKDFLKVFKGILISGNPDTALDAPLKMVLTETRAHVLFGNEDPIGKEVKVNEGMPFKVTGVVKDPPLNTHFKYEYLATLDTWVHYGWIPKEGDWRWNFGQNYIAVSDQGSKDNIQKTLNNLSLLHVNPEKSEGKKIEFGLQPIEDIHLTSNYNDELEANGNLNQVYIIMGVGIAILIIVFINFINLSTTLSLRRSKDTGVRKTLGASGLQLKIQCFIEAFLLNITALVIAVIIVLISTSFIESYFNISLSFKVLSKPLFWFLGILIFGICVLAVSFYPAFVLTSIDVNTAIKGKIVKGRTSHAYIKQALLVVQFCASIFLTIAAYVVYQQVDFMQNYDLGINTNQVLVLQAPTSLNAGGWRSYDEIAIKNNKYNVLRQQLLQNSALKEVASCYSIPGEAAELLRHSVKLKSSGEAIQTEVEERLIDENFFPLYEAEILAGKNFEIDPTQQKTETIINEKALELLGFENPEEAIGQEVFLEEGLWKIRAVVADFHMKSLSDPIVPTFYSNRHPFAFGHYLVKLSPQNLRAQMDFIESKWHTMYPEDPFLAHFSDSFFNKQYNQYKQFGNIFNALTILAILIANLGLLAMVSLTTVENLKAIAVRRVLGADNKAVFMLMSKGYIMLIIIAATIAIPLTWCFLMNWLNNFAYRIEIQSLVFVSAVLLILMVAVCNIMYYVLKVLKLNPAVIIREE